MTDRRNFTVRRNASGYYSATPIPSAEELSQIYREKYYQTAEQRGSSYQSSYTAAQLDHKRLMAHQIIHAVVEATAGDSRPLDLIDVGCGEGFALAAAVAEGWNVRGLDFTNEPAKKCNPDIAAKIQVGDAYELLEEEIASGRSYDACILTNVLEHVREPEVLLQRLGQMLSATGVLAVTVPNDYSRLQQWLLDDGRIDREYWFAPPEHLHYFNSENLIAVCESVGFVVADLYAGFPIEFFLVHEGSRYLGNPAAGKAAHDARVMLDLLMAESGMENFHAYSRGLARCGMGRTLTVVLAKRQEG